MKFRQVSKYLDDCLIFGIKPSLIRIQKILELLGNSHKRRDFIHIVGTNGKTSTVTMAANILHSQGLSCGYHISPHISSYTERFWLNGKNITEKDFCSIFDKLYPYIKKVNTLDLGGPITQFEILTAMSFLIADEYGLDVLVMEAGMGGRWDATNVADALVVGFTGVSLEHTQILGNSIEEIAEEKVEVIKRGARVATLARKEEIIRIIKKKALDTGSKLYLYGKDFFIEKIEDRAFGYNLDLKGIKGRYCNLALNMAGKYQAQNLLLAIVLSELYLSLKDKALSAGSLKEAVNRIKVKGRFQIIREEPMVIADASHNPEGISKFCENIEEYFKNKGKIIIFSVLRDKNYKEMIERVAEVTDTLILTSSETERSLDIDKLEFEALNILKEKGIKIREIYKINNIKNSLNFALNIAKSNDIICITGSITNLEHVV